MTKDTTKEAAAAAESLLLDDWFDAIEEVKWTPILGPGAKLEDGRSV